MRTLSSPTIRLQSVATEPSSLIARLQAWWMAFLNWRIQCEAILQLEALSDRDLHDIGLRRCEIENAVKSEPTRAFSRLLRARFERTCGTERTRGWKPWGCNAAEGDGS